MRRSTTRLPYIVSICFAVLATIAAALFFADGEGRVVRSSLPDRPNTKEFPETLDHRLDAIEKQFRLPWNDHYESLIQLAGVYHINGFSDEALVCYDLLLSEDVDHRDILLYRFADLSIQRGSVSEARKSLHQSLKLQPDYLPAQLKLAEIDYKLGDAEQAMERYRQILDAHKGQPQALLAIARNQLREKQLEEAIVTLKQLAVANPTFTDGVTLLTQALQQKGQDQLAAEIREKAPRQKASPLPDPWLDSLMSDCYDAQRLSFAFENHLKAGEFDRAMKLVDQMKSINPNDPQAYQQRGYAYYQVKKYAEAALAYEKALELGGDPSTVRFFLADSLAKSGAPQKAEAVARNEVSDTGGSADILVLLSDLVADRSVVERMDWLEQALEKDPLYGEANQELSRIYWRLGKRNEAIQLLENVRQLSTDDIASRIMIGRYALERDRPHEAIEPLEEAVAIDMTNQDARALLALACLRMGNEQARTGAFEMAIDSYDRAIDVSADGEEAYLNKVKLCLKLERYDLAESTVADLIERRPDNPVLYVSLGDVRMASGDLQGARESWQEALDMSTGNRELSKAIEQRLKEEG